MFEPRKKMNRRELISPEFFNSENVQISNLLEFSTPVLDEELKRLFCARTENEQDVQRPAACRRSLFAEKQQTFTNSVNMDTNPLTEIMNEFKNNGIDYEYCPQDEDEALDMYYLRTKNESTPEIASSIFNRSKPRKRTKPVKSSSKYCVFCKNNERPPEVYLDHVFRDKNDLLVCPYLRKYVCPLCKATGDNAHTIKYCPRSGTSWSRGPRVGSSSSESSV